jgi:hypothetical protein
MIPELRPEEILWTYWKERILIEEDAELMSVEYLQEVA